MKYVKTYELFNDFFGWSKEARIKKLLAAKEDAKKKEEEVDLVGRASSEKIKHDFIDSVGKYLLSLKNKYIEKIDIGPREKLTSAFNLNVHLKKEAFSGIDYKGIDISIERAVIEMTLGVDIGSESVMITSSSGPTLKIKAREIINSKGDLGDVKDIELPMYKRDVMRYSHKGGRSRSIIASKKTSKEEKSNLENIEKYLNNKIYREEDDAFFGIKEWVKKYIGDRLSKLKGEESLAKFNQIGEDEIKDILADILDMCEGDYVVKKKEGYYSIHGKITGLSSHSDDGLKMNQTTIQVIRHIPEIKDRLNDIDMDMDVHFGSVMTAYNIDIRVYGSGHDVKKPGRIAPRRPAP